METKIASNLELEMRKIIEKEWSNLSLRKRSTSEIGKPDDHRAKIAFLSKDSCKDTDATKPGDLSFIPTSHVTEGEN